MKENRGNRWNDIENFDPINALVWFGGIGFSLWILAKVFLG